MVDIMEQHRCISFWVKAGKTATEIYNDFIAAYKREIFTCITTFEWFVQLRQGQNFHQWFIIWPSVIMHTRNNHLCLWWQTESQSVILYGCSETSNKIWWEKTQKIEVTFLNVISQQCICSLNAHYNVINDKVQYFTTHLSMHACICVCAHVCMWSMYVCI
jgi:hypothetical protein